MDSMNYYVYEWYLNDGRVFYVGKGCGNRYRHILDELKNQNKHGYYYKKLQDDFGINYRIVRESLSEVEALKYESELIKTRREEGNFLIQFIIEPTEDDYKKLIFNNELGIKYTKRDFIPCVRIDDFHKFYYGIKDFSINFDEVTFDRLKHVYTDFKRSFISDLTLIEKEKSEIEEYIIQKKFSKTKNVKSGDSVIIYTDLDYIDYLKYKDNNISILHSFDVIDFIKKNPIQSNQNKVCCNFINDSINYEKLQACKPAWFPNLNKEYSENSNNDNFHIYKKGMDIEKENPFLAIWFYEASLLTEKPWYYYPCYRLVVLYTKFKLKKELYRILKLSVNKVEKDNSYFNSKLLKMENI